VDGGLPERPDANGTKTKSRLGTALPSDYRRMVETFGEGVFDTFLGSKQESWTGLSEDGLLIRAGTEDENL
jgi:hypothetical protein